MNGLGVFDEDDEVDVYPSGTSDAVINAALAAALSWDDGAADPFVERAVPPVELCLEVVVPRRVPVVAGRVSAAPVLAGPFVLDGELDDELGAAVCVVSFLEHPTASTSTPVVAS